MKIAALRHCSNLGRDSTFAGEGLSQCHPLLHTLTEQVVKVDRTKTVSGDAYTDTCLCPAAHKLKCTYVLKWNLDTLNLTLCASTVGVAGQRG